MTRQTDEQRARIQVDEMLDLIAYETYGKAYAALGLHGQGVCIGRATAIFDARLVDFADTLERGGYVNEG